MTVSLLLRLQCDHQWGSQVIITEVAVLLTIQGDSYGGRKSWLWGNEVMVTVRSHNYWCNEVMVTVRSHCYWGNEVMVTVRSHSYWGNEVMVTVRCHSY